MTENPSLEEFLAEAEVFLASRYPRREAEERRPFQWGEGSDEVRVFQEPDPDEEAEAMPRIRAWRAALWDAGFAWISGPPENGGRGLPRNYEAAFISLSRKFDVPGDAALTVSLGMVAPTILRHADERQKQEYLPALFRADLIACQLFSEPDAGSDLASIRTRAVRHGDRWQITGQKVWTSGAHLADVGEIICQTEPGPRHRNLTAFMVDMYAPGVTVRPLRQMTGGASFNEVFLDDVVVPDSARLGAEGEGWRIALTTLSYERNAMGHSAFGGAGILSTDRLMQLIRHAGLANDPLVKRRFGELVTELRVARYAQEVTAERVRSGESPGPEIAINKLALSANMARLGEFVVGILGPRAIADTGEWGTYAWTSVVLGAPGYRLGGGSDEILKNMLAERVLGLPKPT
jgi:alkylation response protein AidB-like acyl-CoA dehydrogenase